LAHAIFRDVPGITKDCMPIALRSSLAGHPLGLVSSLIVATSNFLHAKSTYLH